MSPSVAAERALRDARRRPPRRRLRRAPRHDVPRGHGRVRRRARGVVPPARRRRGRPRPARVPLRGGDRQGPVRHVRANRPHPARRRVGARHGDVVVGGSRAHQRPPPASSSASSSAASSSSPPARIPGILPRRGISAPPPSSPGRPRSSSSAGTTAGDGSTTRGRWTPPPADGAPSPSRRPAPRSGHAMTAAETRHVVSGTSAGGALCGDLWALRDVAGVAAETTNNTAARGGLDRPAENAGAADTAVAADAAAAAVEPSRVAPPRSLTSASPSAPRWTRLRLGGASPCARTGHTLTAGASSSAALIASAATATTGGWCRGGVTTTTCTAPTAPPGAGAA